MTLLVSRYLDSHFRVVDAYSVDHAPRIGERIRFNDGGAKSVAVVDDVEWKLDANADGSNNLISVFATLVERDDDTPVEV